MHNWEINVPIAPKGDHHSHYSIFQKGGVFVTRSIARRNSIPVNRRQLDQDWSTVVMVITPPNVTMWRLINEPGTLYTTNSDWAKIETDLNLHSGLFMKGFWNPDNQSESIIFDNDPAQMGWFYVVTGVPEATQDIQIQGLFGGQITTVSNGGYVIYDGSKYRVQNIDYGVTWNTLQGIPDVIDEYTQGTVIAHVHHIDDIEGLDDQLNEKIDSNDIITVEEGINGPDEKVTSLMFVKNFFFTKQEIEELIAQGITGGHIILNQDGNAVPQREKLQIIGGIVENQADRTIIDISSIIKEKPGIWTDTNVVTMQCEKPIFIWFNHNGIKQNEFKRAAPDTPIPAGHKGFGSYYDQLTKTLTITQNTPIEDLTGKSYDLVVFQTLNNLTTTSSGGGHTIHVNGQEMPQQDILEINGEGVTAENDPITGATKIQIEGGVNFEIMPKRTFDGTTNVVTYNHPWNPAKTLFFINSVLQYDYTVAYNEGVVTITMGETPGELDCNAIFFKSFDGVVPDITLGYIKNLLESVENEEDKLDASAIKNIPSGLTPEQVEELAKIAGKADKSILAEKYVSQLGNDETGDGTKASPYRNIQKAVDGLPDGGTIYLDISMGGSAGVCVLPDNSKPYIIIGNTTGSLYLTGLTVNTLCVCQNVWISGNIIVNKSYLMYYSGSFNDLTINGGQSYLYGYNRRTSAVAVVSSYAKVYLYNSLIKSISGGGNADLYNSYAIDEITIPSYRLSIVNHTHDADAIAETDTRKWVSAQKMALLDKLSTQGEGENEELKFNGKDLGGGTGLTTEQEQAIADVVNKADKTNVLELDNTEEYTPTADYHPATKKYVDDMETGGSYTHPTGFTNQPTTELTGGNVISRITVNNEGHVTGTSSRVLAAADVGAEPTFTKNTAFNKNFGTTAGTVAEGNHTHPNTGLELGETNTTAYRGDRGKTAYDHSQAAHAPSDANNYVHPANHPPSIITQDANNRFVTDTEKTTWNGKSNLALGETSVTAYRGDRGKTAYDHSQVAHAPADANNYVHPATHPPSIIVQDASNRFVSDTEKANFIKEYAVLVCSDKGVDIVAGVDVERLDSMPFAGTLTGLKAAVLVAPTGAPIIIDVLKNGVSMLSTKIYIDAGTTSSTASTTQYVISTATIAINDKISINIDQPGATIAGKELKVFLNFERS
jgi:hypothetical protein